MYSKRSIAVYYLKTTFFVDVIALIPYFMHIYLQETSVHSGLWRLYYLKVVRLIFSRSINNSIDVIFSGKGFMEQHGFFYKKTRNYAIMFILYVKYALSLHMMACMWI